MRHQFAALRQKYNITDLDLINFEVVPSSTGFSNSGTIYLSVQGQNRVGYNLPSDLIRLDYSEGEEIRITLKGDIKYIREDIFSIIISGCLTGNPIDLFRIASYEGSIFPHTIVLNKDSHLVLNGVIPNPEDLPQDPVNGMGRGISSLDKFYYFVSGSTETNNSLMGTGGRWHPIGSLGTFVRDINQFPGCNVSLDEIGVDDILVPPNTYSLDGSAGEILNYWLVNDTPYDIPAGYRISLNIGINGENKSKLFNSKLKTIFYGFVSLEDGLVDITNSLDGNMSFVDQPVYYLYGYQPSMVLQKPLPSNSAFSIGIYPEFSSFELKGHIVPGDILNIGLGLQALSGEYTPIGEITGDLIFNKGDLKRVVPNVGRSVSVLTGSGVVDSFSFPAREPIVINNLTPNLANQKIAINGDGAVFLETEVIEDTEALRSLVGTVSGESNPGNWGNYSNITSGTIKVILNYPSDNNGNGLIRGDYPDVVAGYTGKFNPYYINIYIQQESTGNIYKLANQTCIPGATQEINITNLPGSATSLYTNSDIKFSLFSPGSTVVSNGLTSGSIPVGNFRVCYSFGYNGNQVTSISHSESDGCIPEAGGTLSNLFTRTKYWGESLTNIALLREISKENVFHGQTRKVRIGNIWHSFTYDSSSNLTDNGSSIIKPNDISGAGRFIEDTGVDVSDFLSKSINQTITAKHTFNPSTPTEPFLLGTNAQNQLIQGLNADKLDGLDSSDFAEANHTHSLASANNSGFMSVSDFNKLASIDPNATSPVSSVYGRTGAITAQTGDYSIGQITGAGNAASLNIGTTTGTVAAGDDARFTDSRLPTGIAGGDLTGDYPNPVLTNTGVTPGTYSSFTVDAKGRITQASSDLTLPTDVAYLDERQVWTKAQRSSPINLVSSPLISLDPTLSNRFKLYLQHNTIVTINDEFAEDGDAFGLCIKQEGGRTLSISNGKFPNGLQPELPLTSDTITYIGCERYFDVWVCSFSGASFL